MTSTEKVENIMKRNSQGLFPLPFGNTFPWSICHYCETRQDEYVIKNKLAWSVKNLYCNAIVLFFLFNFVFYFHKYSYTHMNIQIIQSAKGFVKHNLI